MMTIFINNIFIFVLFYFFFFLANASTYVLCPPSDIENSKFSVQKDEMGYVEVITIILNIIIII